MADLTRPIKPRVVVTAATLASVMNGWHAGGMRRVHNFGVSCVIRGVFGALAGSSSEVSDGDVTLGWPWDSADRVFGPYGLDEPAMAHLTRPIKPRSHDRSHAGISHERLARRRYAPCPRFWRLLFDPWSFRGTRRVANPEVSDGDATLGWPWDAADRVFGPYRSFAARPSTCSTKPTFARPTPTAPTGPLGPSWLRYRRAGCNWRSAWRGERFRRRSRATSEDQSQR